MDLLTIIINRDTKKEIGSYTCSKEELEIIFQAEKIEIENNVYRVKSRVYTLHPSRSLKIYVTDKSAVDVLM